MATGCSWVGFGLIAPVVTVSVFVILWLARRQAAEAGRQAEEERRKRIEARQIDQAIVASVKRDNVKLSRQVGRDRGQRIRAVGELKRRRNREDKLRQQLAVAHREIERLRARRGVCS